MVRKSVYDTLDRNNQIACLGKYYIENTNASDTVSFLKRMITKNCGKLIGVLNCDFAAERLLVEGVVAYYIVKEDDVKHYLPISPRGNTTLNYNGKHYCIDLDDIGTLKPAYYHSSMIPIIAENIVILRYNENDTNREFSFLDGLFRNILDKNDMFYESIINKVTNIIFGADKYMCRSRKIKNIFSEK